jgi:hypothetical protein
MAAKAIAVKKYVVRLSEDERCRLNETIRKGTPKHGSRTLWIAARGFSSC